MLSSEWVWHDAKSGLWQAKRFNYGTGKTEILCESKDKLAIVRFVRYGIGL